MGSSCQLEKVLPLLAVAGVGVGVIIAKRIKVFDYFIKEHTSPKKDYIDGLPDDILCHIITYLDMRDAARTSVLSRRWRNLYCTPPNRKFEGGEINEFLTRAKRNRNYYKQRFVTAVVKFVNGVDKLLGLPFDLWRWLDRNVHHLDIIPIALAPLIVGVLWMLIIGICLYYGLLRLGYHSITRAANALLESLGIIRAANALNESLPIIEAHIIEAHLPRALQELSHESCDLDKAPFCPFS